MLEVVGKKSKYKKKNKKQGKKYTRHMCKNTLKFNWTFWAKFNKNNDEMHSASHSTVLPAAPHTFPFFALVVQGNSHTHT